jgi:hypothetical protein
MARENDNGNEQDVEMSNCQAPEIAYFIILGKKVTENVHFFL